MRIYADTSALIAWFHPADHFAEAVTVWCRERSPVFYWNPLLRIELRHNLRKLSSSYAGIAWQAYRMSETSDRLRLDAHRLSELIECGDELSEQHARQTAAGTWDYVHVAIAKLVQAEAFVTCDSAQAALARTAGLGQVQLFI